LSWTSHKKSFNTPKKYSEALNRRTDDTMAKRENVD
jgi:hypothetical protein